MATTLSPTASAPPLTTTSIKADTSKQINIGTRKSALAMIQTELVLADLHRHSPSYSYTVHAMSTMGDKNQVTPLHDFGAKSLWTHELEAQLLDGQLDMIVHSLKDMPTQLPPRCTIGAILSRGSPSDALVMSPRHSAYKTLASLPSGSVVGTSSVRRSAQIARLHPHLRFKDVRGNVGTRLGKLDDLEGEYACLILAAAGLERMGLGDRITSLLTSKTEGGGMLHAVGQGALGVEIREDDERVRDVLKGLECKKTALACLSERSLLRTLEGGCSVPIGVETEWQTESRLSLTAMVVSLDGKEAVEDTLVEMVETEAHADEFGRQIARKLIEGGAEQILKKITLNRDLVNA